MAIFDCFRPVTSSYGVSQDRWTSLEDQLESFGYQQHKYSGPYKTREPWMAPIPTVLYYKDSAMPAANRLATQMKQLTGQSFVVQRGAGLGVEPGEEATTLFVHIVSN